MIKAAVSRDRNGTGAILARYAGPLPAKAAAGLRRRVASPSPCLVSVPRVPMNALK